MKFTFSPRLLKFLSPDKQEKNHRSKGNLFLPAEDGGEGIKVGVDHLLARGRRVLGELYSDPPVVAVAPREQYSIPLVAPRRRTGFSSSQPQLHQNLTAGDLQRQHLTGCSLSSSQQHGTLPAASSSTS
jgi:hypothetical protein